MAAPQVILVSLLVAYATANTYSLTDNWYGTTFFNNFNFFTAADPTHGYVTFVDQGTAQAQGLISATTDSGPVYMGADHTNVASGSGRNSVRITSKKTFNGGLFLIDLTHMPTGCGTWPAFWMTASDVTWPQHGEIDIIEGVNTGTVNAATLHTTPGCDMSSVPTSSFTGKWSANAVGGASSNCDVNAANQYSNAGCGVQSSQANSFGAPFNSNNGGVYATLWDNSATGSIKIWFFPRNAIPGDITSGNPNPSGWGNPMTNFQLGSNCPTSHFQNQQIIFDLTFCGDWAGNVFGASGCSGDCATFVENNPSSFVESYWLINSVKAYASVAGSTPAPSSGGSCSLWTDQDYYGNDLVNGAQSSAAACCSWCKSYSGCNAWSYAGGVCYLKYAAGSRVSASGVTTGLSTGGGSATCTSVANSDYSSGDFQNAPQPSSTACCSYCLSTSGCKAWAYFQGVCYLKNQVNALVSKSGCTAGAVSGSFVEEASFVNHAFLETHQAGSSSTQSIQEAAVQERLIKRMQQGNFFQSNNHTQGRDLLSVLQP